MATKSHEFIEHYNWKNRFVTDIWKNGTTGKYSSVWSDLFVPAGFDSLEAIRESINTTMEEASNHEKH